MSWTFINKDDVENYRSQYKQLDIFWEELKLLETNDAIFLPRLFSINYPSKYLKTFESKKASNFQSINIKFRGELRNRQKEAVAAVSEMYKNKGHCNGILKLYPGAGKTILSVFLSSFLKKKTCIIVDNDQLMKQWITAYLDFSDLTINDIGIVKQKNFNMTKPVTIATVQTLLSKVKTNLGKAFSEIENAGFDLIIYDEVHATSASENFSKVSLLFKTENVIGLSATPFQYGGAELLMKNTIGDIIYETNAYELSPKYYFAYYDSGLTKYNGVINRCQDYIQKKALYNSKIVESEKYLSLITNYTSNLEKNGHNTMIVCITKKQVLAISESLEKAGIKHRRFYGDEREIDKLTDTTIVSTYKFTGRGFDMKRLSALILACPLSGRKSVIQVIGRILRECESKLEPLVVDMIDLCYPLLFMPEVKRKIGILKNEFQNCQIYEHRENE